jgi:nitrate reductase delta subunit
MLGRARPTAETLAATERLKTWTRARFRLGDDDAVMVAELSCGLPGCPPLETVVAFWTAPDLRHQFKVFKSLQEVLEDDLPPAFLKPTLVADEADISCC